MDDWRDDVRAERNRTMKVLQIHDESRNRVLAFDIKDVLAALGTLAASSQWKVARAEHFEGEEYFEATGEGGTELESLAQSGSRISGLELQDIANRTRQVIWGIFAGYKSSDEASPWIVIYAFDSSWYEVHTDSDNALDLILKNFLVVRVGVPRTFSLN